MRPRTIGELLDRAVTLFVQNAWTFVALAAIVYVPLALAQLTMGDFWKWYLDAFSKMMASPGSAGAAVAMDQQLVQRAGPVELFTLALMLFVAPLVVAAMAHATMNLLEGTRAKLAEALRFAVLRWGRVVLFAVVWIVAVAVMFLAEFLALGLLAALLGATMRIVALIVVFAVVAFCAVVVCMLLAMISGGVGMMAAINEPGGAFAALGSGIQRTINRKMFWRSLLAGLLLFAISFGFSIMSSMAGFALLAALHTGVPLVIINAAVAMVQFGFLTVFLVLFYDDLRVRREGGDLETLASQLSA